VEQPWDIAIEQLKNDNLTEFGSDEINSLQKFHLAPELIIAALYKCFILVTEALNIPTVSCYHFDNSFACEGLGEPIFFYLSVVWSFSALAIISLYMHSMLLHNNGFAGFAAVIYYVSLKC